MGPFVSGQVVVLPFPLSDLSGVQKRPVLVLACGGYNDLIVCMITARRLDIPVGTDYSLEITDSDFVEGKLRESVSFVRPDRLFTAEPTLVGRIVGRLQPSKMKEILHQLSRIFKLEDQTP
jgi:mRNA interferase MazF